MEAQKITSNPKIFLLCFISILVAIGGAFTGVAMAIIGSLFYIVFLFPLGMGFVGGNIIKLGVRLAKIRKTSQVVFLSIVVTASIYGTYHYGRYVGLQVQTYLRLSSELSEANEMKSLKVAKALTDYALIKKTGHSGFIGYVLYKAQKGVALGRVTSSDGVNIGPVLTWAYWLLEFVIIFWVAMSIAKQEAQVPVCEVCGSRLGKEKHLGGTAPANESLLLDLIHRREFVELGKLIEKNEDLPSMELYLQTCEACQKGNARITVRRAFQNTRGAVQFADISNVTLRSAETILLSQEFKFSN